jgi:hypothetical protein
MTSTYDQLIHEGMEKGLAKGKADTLLELLEKRFGSLPADVVARIHSADVRQLDDWLLRILDARSLDEVFADA